MDLVDVEVFLEYEQITETMDDKNPEEKVPPSPTLLVSVTTDDANVLKRRRSGACLRIMCNELLLHSHCVSHRCQLELKKAEKDYELCEEVNDFLEEF